MQQRSASHDTQVAPQAPSGAASLTLHELAALLKIGLDGANIDRGVNFTLRRVQEGVGLYRAGDPFGPIYAHCHSGTSTVPQSHL